MKTSSNMKLISSLFAASLLFTATSNASEIKTAGQAMSLCKAHATKSHDGYKRSKSTNIKHKRGIFKIKMKVVTAQESISTYCEVAKDGTVSYSKA